MVLLEGLTFDIQCIQLSTWGQGRILRRRGPWEIQRHNSFSSLREHAGKWEVESLRERKSVEATRGLSLVCL